MISEKGPMTAETPLQCQAPISNDSNTSFIISNSNSLVNRAFPISNSLHSKRRCRSESQPQNSSPARRLPPYLALVTSTGDVSNDCEDAWLSEEGAEGYLQPETCVAGNASYFMCAGDSAYSGAKEIWAYIKQHDLQDPENKKVIICDQKLKTILADKDRVGFLEFAGLISPYFLQS